MIIENDKGYGSPDHGKILDILVPRATHDLVITIDSDFFILQNHVINDIKSNFKNYDVAGSIGGRIDGNADLKDLFHKQVKRKLGRICPWFSIWKKEIFDKLNYPTFKSVFVSHDNSEFQISDNNNDCRYATFSNELWLETMGWITYLAITKLNIKVFDIAEKCEKYHHMAGVSMGVRKYMKDMNTGNIFDRNVLATDLPCRHLYKIFYNYIYSPSICYIKYSTFFYLFYLSKTESIKNYLRSFYI